MSTEGYPSVTLHHGDCIEVMRTLPDNSVDAIVTDPPYGLGFMGKAWDDLPPGKEWAEECLRVLKPGGHLLAFGGSRTWHRLAVAVEDAGFEIRDGIMWLYGSGFPKSLDVSKAIDKAAGAEREVAGPNPYFARGTARAPEAVTTGASNGGAQGGLNHKHNPEFLTAPGTDEARTWSGWGTALKPAYEPCVVARKPLDKSLGGTVAANVLGHGTGALNIDGCRIGTEGGTTGAFDGKQSSGVFAGNDGRIGGTPTGGVVDIGKGRWPANVILDADAAAALDEQSGILTSGGGNKANRKPTCSTQVPPTADLGIVHHPDSGGASRFFYVAKAPKRERPVVVHEDGTRTAHPTVKPVTLMRHLVRLVTPPGGTVLEPFAGSGATVEAALLEGFDCIAIEREAEYLPLIEQRIARASAQLAEQDGAA